MRTVNVSEDDLGIVLNGGATDQSDLDEAIARLRISLENQTNGVG